MVRFDGLSVIYLFRVFVYKFLFPGLILIIAAVLAGPALGHEPVYSLLAGYLAAFLLAFLLTYFVAKGTQYILTDKRLIKQEGYFEVSLTSAVFDKITHIEVRQSFLEKSLYHYGTVVVYTAGSQNKEIVIKNIKEPMKFKNHLEKLINNSQKPSQRRRKFREIRRIQP